ncbi:MAG: NAD(P)/FAD-dependent oxidoreductase [Verrucomicrobiae bacterium]|nr:NAD(P)/FAD-dependent oxidoreductase [Verrucomicrobiae bacterium]
MTQNPENARSSDSRFDYDFVVIGGGSGGYAAARTAHEAGLKTAVIDGAETLGGLCILRGCMPSKTLIESANRARTIRRARDFGLRAENFAFHGSEIISRKRALIQEFAGYRQQQLEDDRFDLIRGVAAFEDPHSLRITMRDGGEERSITFATACVATGSVIQTIDLPGLEECGYWTSDDVLDSEEIPPSIVVLGGGAIALEMACYFEGLGCEVTVVQRSEQVLSGSDRDVAKALEEAISSRENLNLFTGTSLQRVERSSDGRAVVHFLHDGVPKEVSGERILLALGRKPAIAGLNLETAGVELDERGRRIATDRRMRTSRPHIFAAGDVCSPIEVVHVAIEQGEVAAHEAARMLGKLDAPEKSMDYRLKLFGVFTDPQVATVGIGEDEARSEGREVVAASYPFDDHGKSMVMGETHGFVKLIADAKTRTLIGGAVVGPEAAEIIHEIVVALKFNCTAEQFLEIPHYHPTLSEIWTYPAEELLEL